MQENLNAVAATPNKIPQEIETLLNEAKSVETFKLHMALAPEMVPFRKRLRDAGAALTGQVFAEIENADDSEKSKKRGFPSRKRA